MLIEIFPVLILVSVFDKSYSLNCYYGRLNSTYKPSSSSLQSCSGSYCFKLKRGDYVDRGCASSYNFPIPDNICQSWGNNCKSCVNVSLLLFNVNSNDCTLCCCDKKDGCNSAVSNAISVVIVMFSVGFGMIFKV